MPKVEPTPAELKVLLQAYVSSVAAEARARAALGQANAAVIAAVEAKGAAWREVTQVDGVAGVYLLDGDWMVELGAGDFPLPLQVRRLTDG